MLNRLQQHWAVLAQIAAWLAGLVGAFLLAPPKLWPRAEDVGPWLHLSQFLIAIMVGLIFVRPGGRPRNAGRWRWIAIAAVVAGLVLFVAYQVLRPSWTCSYLGETVIQGGTNSPAAQEFLAGHAGAPCWLLIAAALGKTTDLWPMSELITRYILLCAVYTFAMLSFSAAVMATITFVRGGASADGEAPAPRKRRTR
jgi:hypothetical protein